MTLSELQKLFPSKTAHAVTGHIPMEWVKANEKELREALKGEGVRRVYRGKRNEKGISWDGKKRYESSTRVADARAVVIYRSGKTYEEWKAEHDAFNNDLRNMTPEVY